MTKLEETFHKFVVGVAVVFGSAAAVALVLDAADARRRHRHGAPAKVVESVVGPEKIADRADAARVVRTIPIIRWKVWCERIGGNECP